MANAALYDNVLLYDTWCLCRDHEPGLVELQIVAAKGCAGAFQSSLCDLPNGAKGFPHIVTAFHIKMQSRTYFKKGFCGERPH